MRLNPLAVGSGFGRDDPCRNHRDYDPSAAGSGVLVAMIPAGINATNIATSSHRVNNFHFVMMLLHP